MGVGETLAYRPAAYVPCGHTHTQWHVCRAPSSTTLLPPPQQQAPTVSSMAYASTSISCWCMKPMLRVPKNPTLRGSSFWIAKNSCGTGGGRRG